MRETPKAVKYLKHKGILVTFKMKTCLSCKKPKPLDQYQLRTDTGKYRNQCKNCRQIYVNKYRRTNEDYKKRYNQYRKHRRNTDEKYLLQERLRARIRKSLICQNADKCLKSMELLGCDIETFKRHIENQFKNDMSWEKRNFVIDHIIPCASFDLTKIEEQKKCFHYTNQQPLTWEENAEKSDKILKL